jgi:hypothetical protein
MSLVNIATPVKYDKKKITTTFRSKFLLKEISQFWIWVFVKSFRWQIKTSLRQQGQIGFQNHIHAIKKALFWTSNPSHVSKISFSVLMSSI